MYSNALYSVDNFEMVAAKVKLNPEQAKTTVNHKLMFLICRCQCYVIIIINDSSKICSWMDLLVFVWSIYDHNQLCIRFFFRRPLMFRTSQRQIFYRVSMVRKYVETVASLSQYPLSFSRMSLIFARTAIQIRYHLLYSYKILVLRTAICCF